MLVSFDEPPNAVKVCLLIVIKTTCVSVRSMLRNKEPCNCKTNLLILNLNELLYYCTEQILLHIVFLLAKERSKLEWAFIRNRALKTRDLPGTRTHIS